MPRLARVVVPEVPYHITQRGNYKQNVFEDDEDMVQYLEWIRDYSYQYDLEIWAYCLMSDHVHFIVYPKQEKSMSMTFSQAHMRYSHYYNRKICKQGHLWQGRFHSCALDAEHLYEAVRYVEMNPVRAGIEKLAEDYPWSSARSHIKRLPDVLLPLSNNLPLLKDINNWAGYLIDKADEKKVKNIENNTSTGRPAGNKTFISEIEKKTGRVLTAKSKGRPVKANK